MMKFDQDKFRNRRYVDRRVVVKVPALIDFFPDGEPAEMMVRGLTGEELANAIQEMKQNRAASKVICDLDATETFKEALRTVVKGTGGTVTDSYALGLAMVRIGTGLDHDVVVRIGMNFPVVLEELRGQIDILTGMGRATEGESNASGVTTG